MAISDTVRALEYHLGQRWPQFEFRVEEQELADGRFSYDVYWPDGDGSPTAAEVAAVFNAIKARAPEH